MPRKKRDDARLWDMLHAAGEVRQFVAGKTWEDYQRDTLLRRGVERSIEIIGEASREPSDAMKAAHPEVPWSKIFRQRHRLAHDYDVILDEVIWRVATVHVPELVRTLTPILNALPPADPS